MKLAKMGFLLGIFIFCSVTVPVLSGVARLTHNICRKYKESCNMDMDPGSCYEVHFRFFYNRTAGECQSFVFTGCNGNLNNYRLKIECDIECNEEYRTVRISEPEPEPESFRGRPQMGHLKQSWKKVQANAEVFGKCPQSWTLRFTAFLFLILSFLRNYCHH